MQIIVFNGDFTVGLSNTVCNKDTKKTKKQKNKMETTIEIFDKFGLPVSMIIILIMFCYFLLKNHYARVEKVDRQNDEYIKHLQDATISMAHIIEENTKAINSFTEFLKQNTDILKNFSKIIQELEFELKKRNNKNDNNYYGN